MEETLVCVVGVELERDVSESWGGVLLSRMCVDCVIAKVMSARNTTYDDTAQMLSLFVLQLIFRSASKLSQSSLPIATPDVTVPYL